METVTFIWANEAYKAIRDKGSVKIMAPSGVELFTIFTATELSADVLRMCVTTYAIGYSKAERQLPRGF